MHGLWPREHGAYVQLLAPMSVALLSTGGGGAAALFAAGALLAFAANEPLLVLLGHRGRRACAQAGARARRLLRVLAPLAIAASLAGFVLAPPSARAIAAAVAVPAAVLVALAWRRKERSIAGELVAAVVLPGAAAPVAVAAGARWPDAALLWAAWTCGYACTVVAVHRVIARHRRAPTGIDRLAALGLVAATIAFAALGAARAHALAALPLAASSAALVIAAPPATRLRAIGIALLGASAISVGLVLALAPG